MLLEHKVPQLMRSHDQGVTQKMGVAELKQKAQEQLLGKGGAPSLVNGGGLSNGYHNSNGHL